MAVRAQVSLLRFSVEKKSYFSKFAILGSYLPHLPKIRPLFLPFITTNAHYNVLGSVQDERVSEKKTIGAMSPFVSLRKSLWPPSSID